MLPTGLVIQKTMSVLLGRMFIPPFAAVVAASSTKAAM